MKEEKLVCNECGFTMRKGTKNKKEHCDIRKAHPFGKGSKVRTIVSHRGCKGVFSETLVETNGK